MRALRKDDELQQIVSFIHSGGLDRARALQIVDLREQERRLRVPEGRVRTDWGTQGGHTSLDGGWLAAGAVIELIGLIADQSG